MSNRFPPLAAPIPSSLTAPRVGSIPTLPLWARSLPMGEMLVLTALGLFLVLA